MKGVQTSHTELTACMVFVEVVWSCLSGQHETVHVSRLTKYCNYILLFVLCFVMRLNLVNDRRMCGLKHKSHLSTQKKNMMTSSRCKFEHVSPMIWLFAYCIVRSALALNRFVFSQTWYKVLCLNCIHNEFNWTTHEISLRRKKQIFHAISVSVPASVSILTKS